MNDSVENKPVELTEEETKQVAGGATAVEFGLIAANISTVIIAGVTEVGQKLATKVTAVSNALK
jgi:Flp pilus assembly pilin Flp